MRSLSSSPQVANPSQGGGLEVQSDMSLDPRDSLNSRPFTGGSPSGDLTPPPPPRREHKPKQDVQKYYSDTTVGNVTDVKELLF